MKYILQGGFVISDIVFGCDGPTCNPSPVRELSLLTGIECAHSIFRQYNPVVLSFGEAMQGDLTNHGLVYEE